MQLYVSDGFRSWSHHPKKKKVNIPPKGVRYYLITMKSKVVQIKQLRKPLISIWGKVMDAFCQNYCLLYPFSLCICPHLFFFFFFNCSPVLSNSSLYLWLAVGAQNREALASEPASPNEHIQCCRWYFKIMGKVI